MREIPQTLPGAHVDGIARNVFAAEGHASAVRLDESDDHVEGRRLARAVRSQKPHDLAARAGDVHPVDDRAVAIRLHELLGDEIRGLLPGRQLLGRHFAHGLAN